MVSDILFGAVMGTAQAISSKRDFEREVFAQDRERAARMDELRETYRIQGENQLAVERERIKQQETKQQAETDQKLRELANSFAMNFRLGVKEANEAARIAHGMGIGPNAFVSPGGSTALTNIAARANSSSKMGAATGGAGTPPLPGYDGEVPSWLKDQEEVPNQEFPIGTRDPFNETFSVNGDPHVADPGKSQAAPIIEHVTKSLQKRISDPNLNSVNDVQTQVRLFIPQGEINAGVAEPKYPNVVDNQAYLAEMMARDIFQNKTVANVNGKAITLYPDAVRPGAGAQWIPTIQKAAKEGGIAISILASNPQDQNKLSNARRKQLVNLLADAVFSTAQEEDKVSADVLRGRYEDTLDAISSTTDDLNLGEDILASYARRNGIPESNVPMTNGVPPQARGDYYATGQVPASAAPTAPEAEKRPQAAPATSDRAFGTLRKILPPEFQGATDFDDLSDMVRDKIRDPNTPASQKIGMGEILLQIKNLREGQQAGGTPSEGREAATPNDLLEAAFSEQYKDRADANLAALDRMLKERSLSRSDIENVKWMEGRTGLILTIKGRQWPVKFNNKK